LRAFLINRNLEFSTFSLASTIEDIEREAAGEVILSKEAKSAISRKTAAMFKQRLKTSLYSNNDDGRYELGCV
jgi:hypothetical protein